MKVCVTCKIEHPESNFYMGSSSCILCKKKYDKHYRESHREKLLDYQRARRDSPDGYVDRFIERAHQFTPDTDISRIFFKVRWIDARSLENSLRIQIITILTMTQLHPLLTELIVKMDTTHGILKSFYLVSIG
jgi:hypothetical protein